jgi:2-polyprenyl-3-methyl-5-hydroxy-6-metoxy-1,4-benzoquinol methylase
MTVIDTPIVQESTPASSPSAAADGCLVCSASYGPCDLPGLKRCTSCDFITADMTLSDAELSALYSEDYFHGNEYRNYVSEEASLKDNFRRRITTLKELIPDLRQRRVFEIGCAYGFFLDEVKNDVAVASGIDISADATRYARETKGVDAITGSYSEYTAPTDVGVVAMWDTIEHLPRPDLFVEKAARDIARGGYIAITTGDIASLNARMRGKRWRMIHPPTHMHYFSVATLSKLLDRHGFDIVHVSHPGNARDLRSILHFILDLRLGWGGLYRRVAGWRIFNLSLSMNLFDIMFIVARRRDA